jgi:hypothetical protein
MIFSEEESFYTPEEQQRLAEKLDSTLDEYSQMANMFISYPFTSEEAKKFARHGLCRRLGTLYQCIEHIFDLCPVSQSKKLDDDAYFIVNVCLQAFVINLYGVIDNMAWTLVEEKGYTNNGEKLVYSDV